MDKKAVGWLDGGMGERVDEGMDEWFGVEMVKG